MAKKEGYIIEEIIEQSNLEESFDTVVHGTLRKSLEEGKWLLEHREEFLASVRNEILSGNISLMPIHRQPTEIEIQNGGFTPKDIVEGGKHRKIQVYCMAARIKINAVMSVVDKHLRKRYIRTTCASIKNRGMHDLKEYIERDMKLYPDIKFWYKFDIRKCYETIKQDFVMYAYRKVFKDKLLLKILDAFTRMMDEGLSLGKRDSQTSCNLLLSIFLDHYLKDRYGIKHFYRYCDDGLIGHHSKLYLWWCRDITHECIAHIGQEIKKNERVFPIEEGLDFLGYKIFPDERKEGYTYAKLRKRVKQKNARKLAKLKSRKKRETVIGSLWGLCKHGKCWHLLETLLYPSELNKLKKKRMKTFSELGISYKPSDGKKRFPNKATQLRQLVNIRIEVLDFEIDVKTKYGERCLVMYRDTRTNELSKFFTDCDEMKQNLAQAKDMGEIPFSTVIAAEYFGDNKVKYKFT